MIDLHPTKCNLCGGRVVYTTNDEIYGKQYGSGYCYICSRCKAYVGTHLNHPKDAMGILANKQMRELKMRCHDIFDKMWNTSNERREMYHKLSNKMGIPLADCHFGYFNLGQLWKALLILKEWRDNVSN